MQFDAPAPADHVVKLLVTGPFNAGKTTLISAISETPVVDTDIATTGDEMAVKATTTVAMDFGTYHLRDEEGRVDLLLFGTPGQPRFSFMTDIMKGDVDAVISVVDAEDESTHHSAGVSMRRLLKDLHVPLAIAVNRCDDPARAIRLARSLGALSNEIVVPCQLIHEPSARDVVIAALEAALAGLERPGAIPWRPPLHRVIESIASPTPGAA